MKLRYLPCIYCLICAFGLATPAYASEQPVIINNNNNSGAQNANDCDPAKYDKNPGTPAGTYHSKSPNGSSTVYTTGEKNPYRVDNPCNNQSLVQPYLYSAPIVR